MTQSRNRTGNLAFFNLTNLSTGSIDNASSNKSMSSKKRGKGIEWSIKCEYDTGLDADIIRKGDEWAYYYSGNSVAGRYIVMRCRKSKQKLSTKREEKKNERNTAKRARLDLEVENPADDSTDSTIDQCPKLIKLLYKADSLKVIMYENEEDHAYHDRDILAIDEWKNLINKLFDTGVTKPSTVLHQLRNQNPPLIKCPSRRQLYYELSKIRKDRFGEVKISLKELNAWLLEHSVIPEEDDTPFVVKHESGVNLIFGSINTNLNDKDEDDKEDDENDDFGVYFRFFVTTKRLLSIAIDKDHITTDATYKLLWLGFPVLIVGTTCKNCNYHPYGIGLASNEKTKDFQLMFEGIIHGIKNIYNCDFRPHILQADAARAITKGFEQAFNFESDTEYIRLNCWSHVNRNCDHRLVCIKDTKIKDSIKADLKNIQMSHNTKTFEKLCALFIKKWKQLDDTNVNTFCDYLNDNWIEKNEKWYEGAAPGYPSTNNGNEGTNQDIKDSYTFRERLPLNQFLALMLNIAKSWSIDRNPTQGSEKKIYKEPPLTDRRWSDAIKFAISKTVVEQIHDSYYFNYDLETKITYTAINLYKKYVDDFKFKTFDDYVNIVSTVCRVVVNHENWKLSTCICYDYQKQYMCKHVLGLVIRARLVTPPSHAIDFEFNQKQKRGRKPKAKGGKALIVD